MILELVKHSGLKTQKKFGEKYGFDGAYLSMLKDPNQHYKIPKKMWERFDSIASETIQEKAKEIERTDTRDIMDEVIKDFPIQEKREPLIRPDEISALKGLYNYLLGYIDGGGSLTEDMPELLTVLYSVFEKIENEQPLLHKESIR